MSTPKIQKLDEVVINRIAAGEVIQRPANAIKEMVENCLDAKSKSIQVVVKDGGLKLLQIQDDGCGIRKEDLDIVCERFTTSKLSSFDDLKSISTYGFRGEALASISHVAHLTITTKTSDSPCAYKAKYEDGKMIPLQHGGKVEPKPCAGNKGTQITVEDLFYNVSVRRKALRNPNEEHSKIVDVISKYAIHNPTVGFSLKKSGQNLADVRTQNKSTTIDNIKTIYGPTLSKELLEVTHEDSQYGFKLHGFASNANYSIKKTIILLFINHRLVESTSLRKAIEAVYVNYLPKDKHPFMYISLELNPLNIDVNVHPTKHEVKFLHEEAIIESIQKCLETKLLGANESRQYYTQSLIPKMLSAGVDCPVSDVVGGGGKSDDNNTTKKLYDHQLVRTDAKERKMEAFFPYAASKTDEPAPKDNTNIVEDDLRQDTLDNIISTSPIDELITPPACSNELKIKKDCSSESVKEKVMDVDDDDVKNNRSSKHTMKQKVSGNCKEDGTKKETIKNTPTERVVKLSSIRSLRRAIDADEHLGLKSLLQEHKFVGCVNQSLALIQHLTQLYLVNVEKLSQHLFYQIIIFRFGNMGYLELSEPAPIRELVRLVLDTPDSGWEPEDGDKDDLARFSSELLTSKADMLLDYFSVEINEKGEITAMPSLLDNYIPNWNKLPKLLLRLASEVDWDNEERCFRDFAEELSHFYSCGGNPFIGENEAEESEKEYNHTIEHAIFPALRTDFIPPKSLSTDGTFLEVANLPDLYKVFERC